MKQWITNWLTNNRSLKVISVFASFFIWAVVVNYDNPYQTRTIHGIPIETTNEDVLTANDMIYAVVEGQTASVRVRCPRKVAQSLRTSDFRAVADFKDMYSLTNQIPITVTCTNVRVSADEVTPLTHSLEVEIETISTLALEVQTQIVGTPSVGYKVGYVSCSPATIRVSGPTSFLDQVRYAAVTINVDGLAKSVSRKAPVQLYSAGGTPLDTSGVTSLSVSDTEVDVDVEILNVKTVNVNYNVMGQEEVAEGYQYTGIDLSQTTVEISGRRSDLAGVSSIDIPEGALDVTDADENIEKHFDLRELLPEGVYLVNAEDFDLGVTLKIEKQATREFAFTITAMEILNLPEGLELTNPDAESRITLQGLATDLDALSSSEIQVKIDLKGMSPGTHSAALDITVPHGFTVVGSPYVLVRLSTIKETTRAAGGVEIAPVVIP